MCLGGIVIVVACAATLAIFLAHGRGQWPPELPLAAVLAGLGEGLAKTIAHLESMLEDVEPG